VGASDALPASLFLREVGESVGKDAEDLDAELVPPGQQVSKPDGQGEDVLSGTSARGVTTQCRAVYAVYCRKCNVMANDLYVITGGYVDMSDRLMKNHHDHMW
jgi:hypothetical protein